MKGLYGIGNTNIFNTLNMLKKIDSSLKIQTLGFEDSVKPRANVILVPTVSLFLKRKNLLEESSSSVFVFDTPVLLDYLKPIEILDAKKSTSFKYKLYELQESQLRDALSEKRKIKIKKEDIDIIPSLLNSTIPSIMKPIQTFLYSIPNTENRLFYNKEILSFFKSKSTSTKDLRKSLILLSKQKKSFKALDKLIDFLNEDSVVNTKNVILKVLKYKKNGKAPNIDKLSSDRSVSAYDVRYILKASSSHDRSFTHYPKGKSTDEFFQEFHDKKKSKASKV